MFWVLVVVGAVATAVVLTLFAIGLHQQARCSWGGRASARPLQRRVIEEQVAVRPWTGPVLTPEEVELEAVSRELARSSSLPESDWKSFRQLAAAKIRWQDRRMEPRVE